MNTVFDDKATSDALSEFWLTESQVIAITKKVRPAAQKRVLDELNYHYDVRADGTFLVPKAQFQPERLHKKKHYDIDLSHLGNK